MNKIFLDNNSTTPVDPDVLDSMIPYFTEKFGNPSSRTHAYGWEAEAAVDIAREEISNLINADEDEIIFTSGATESNNLIFLNILKYSHKNIITATTEHKAILDICDYINKNSKNNIIYIHPEKTGIINLDKLAELINPETYMISIMHVNNEIGVIQPIKEIGKLCKSKKILFHVDAAQSYGKLDIDVKEMNIDFLSISAHKIYGPKGIGVLYINRKNKVSSIMYGGSQEKSLRPGTLAVPLIVGFGKASKIASIIMKKESKTILNLRNILFEQITSNINDVHINGCMENRISGNLNFSFPQLKGQSIINSIPRIAVSSGSACTSSSPTSSHVLHSIGLSNKLSNSSIRIGIGRFNSEEQILSASNDIITAVRKKTS
jgi:cysteine desulfurase